MTINRGPPRTGSENASSSPGGSRSALNDAYYEYRMSRVLDRPIALIGFYGANQAHAALWLTSLTGLPFHALDSLIEHRAGRSKEALLETHGAAALQRIESECLSNALEARPCGIVALTPRTLSLGRNRRLVAKACRLVHLKLDVFSASSSLRREMAENPGRVDPEVADLAERPKELAKLLRRYESGYRQAELTVEIADRSPRQVAQEVLTRLGLGF